MVLAFTSSSGRSMRYSPTFSNPHSHSHCLPSPLLFQSSLPQRFNLHSMAVKPIKRVRCELQAKVNGALSADSDPLFIDQQKALEAAMNDINSSFGKGSVTRLGSAGGALVETFPSGCLTLDLALGGGLPKGRIVEVCPHCVLSCLLNYTCIRSGLELDAVLHAVLRVERFC